MPRSFMPSWAEIRMQAILLAVVSWGIVAIGFSAPGMYTRFGPLKWTDFPQFYAMGSLARSDSGAALYDAAARHARQVELVPESADQYFQVVSQPPPYSPLIAAVMAPLTELDYLSAGAVWSTLSLAAVLTTLWVVAASTAGPRLDVVAMCAIVLAFPPTWSLFAHGQTTIFPLLAFATAWAALRRRQRVVAGFCLAFLAFKPQFSVLVAAVMILSAEWLIILGAAISLAAQMLLALALFGRDVVPAYLASALNAASLAAVPEVKPDLQHSIRVLVAVLPAPWSTLMFALLAAAAAAGVTLIWRRSGDPSLKMAALVLGAVLVNPHLYVYDAAVLLLLGPWLASVSGTEAGWLWRRGYILTLLLLFPTRAVLPLQGSVIAMLELGWQLLRRTRA